MHILRAVDYRRMKWKNGGGETAEIAIGPAGAGLNDFDWRVSMARVGFDGPFSAFPGVDRTLTVLEGEGLRLAVEGQEPVGLTPASAPFSFRADLQAAARLLAGPVTDLNVMTRRGRYHHQVWRRRIDGVVEVPLRADVALLFCQNGPVSLTTSEGPVVLEEFDAWMGEAADGICEVTAEKSAILFSIEIERSP
jgi:uncharacterized protein